MKLLKKILITPWIFVLSIYNWIVVNQIIKELRGGNNKPKFCKFSKTWRSMWQSAMREKK